MAYAEVWEGLMMAVRELDRFPGQWRMGIRDLHRRTIMAPTPRERERRQPIRLPAQGWTANVLAVALIPALAHGIRPSA